MLNANQFYQNDLAAVHANDFIDVAMAAATFCKSKMTAKGISNGRIRDLGCGSGQFLHEMSQMGFKGLGIDYSHAMVHLASAKFPHLSFQQGSIWDQPQGPAKIISAVGEVITYAAAGENDLNCLQRFFQRSHHHLPKGGILFFDFLTPDILPENDYHCKIARQKDWEMFLAYRTVDEGKGMERDIILFKLLDNGNYRRSREVHRIRVFELSEIRALLEALNFEVEIHQSFLDYQLRKGHLSIWAEKC